MMNVVMCPSCAGTSARGVTERTSGRVTEVKRVDGTAVTCSPSSDGLRDEHDCQLGDDHIDDEARNHPQDNGGVDRLGHTLRAAFRGQTPVTCDCHDKETEHE